MGKLIVVSAFFAFFVIGGASAQGTAQQRAACERDAHRLCASEEPDAIAVEKCLRANMKALSPKCRRQFGRKR